MEKWEYLALSRQGGMWSDDRRDARSPTEKLSGLGLDGWELVSVAYDGSGYNFYLKRPIAKKKKKKATTKKKKAK